jgi:hypothetical protein
MVLIMGLFMCAEKAGAQGNRYKGEIYGKIGYGWTSEDEGSLGNGVIFGGGVGFMLSNRWELALDIHSQDNERDGGPGRFFHEGRSVTVGGNFLYHFSKSRAQPYLRLGLAYAHFDGVKGFRADELYPETRIEGTQSFWGPDLGFGLKAFVTRHITIRPEVRLFIGGSGEYEPLRDPIEPGLFLTSFAVGIGYHW